MGKHSTAALVVAELPIIKKESTIYIGTSMIQSPYITAMSIKPLFIFNRKQYGVTAPISTNPPSERDLEMTNDLIETLREIGFFEAEEEGEKR